MGKNKVKKINIYLQNTQLWLTEANFIEYILVGVDLII